MYITFQDVNAWFADTKLSLSSNTEINDEREQQIVDTTFPRLASFAAVDTWTDDTDTPSIIRSIIAMYYAAWTYDMTYADDDQGDNRFAARLRRAADLALQGIVEGQVIVEGVTIPAMVGPSFFPNDKSSMNPPTEQFPYDGDSYFMMGTVW
jgi:hypothetical protein